MLIAVGLVGMVFVIFNEVFLGALAGMEMHGQAGVVPGASQVYVASMLGLLVLVLGWGVIAYGTVFALASVIPLVGNWMLIAAATCAARTQRTGPAGLAVPRARPASR